MTRLPSIWAILYGLTMLTAGLALVVKGVVHGQPAAAVIGLAMLAEFAFVLRDGLAWLVVVAALERQP